MGSDGEADGHEEALQIGRGVRVEARRTKVRRVQIRGLRAISRGEGYPADSDSMPRPWPRQQEGAPRLPVPRQALRGLDDAVHKSLGARVSVHGEQKSLGHGNYGFTA